MGAKGRTIAGSRLMIFPPALIEAARALLVECRARGIMVATAESCTGGLIGGLLTEIPGSSDIFDRGFITYSNDSKTALLDVSAELISTYGAVSAPVACAMAEGALGHSKADIAVAVTGVSGPGGSENKPEGLVYFALAHLGGVTQSEEKQFGAIGRAEVRLETVRHAIAMLMPTA